MPGEALACIPLVSGLAASSEAELAVQLAVAHIRASQSDAEGRDAGPLEDGSCRPREGQAASSDSLGAFVSRLRHVSLPFGQKIMGGDGLQSLLQSLSGAADGPPSPDAMTGTHVPLHFCPADRQSLLHALLLAFLQTMLPSLNLSGL